MEEKNISPEQDLIYRIVEQWGNVINMPKMEGWLKEYAATRQTGAVWVRASTLKELNGEYYFKYEYLGKIHKGLGHFDDGMFFSGKLMVVPIGFDNLYLLDESGTATAPLTQSRADLIREANNRDLDGVAGTISQDAHEKEIMMQAFDKVRQIFECRQWIVEGRGSYPYNDDRYKEEVRYMYDEFDALQKDIWKNIESRSIEYRKAIIKEHVKGTAAWKEEAIQRIKDFNLSDVDAPVFTHTKEFASHFSYIKGKLMDILREKETAAGREEDWISVYDQLPEEGGRYLCYVQQLTDLGYSYFQWNCDYNPQLRRFSDMTLKGGHEITHWRPQPEPPKFKQKEK